MPATPETLFARLNELGIRTTTHCHPPLFTVEDSKRLRGALPGGHCKSLFLKDKKDALYLLVALEDRAIDLKSLHKKIDSGRLSFGRPELLWEVLGIKPGAVTPFALMNDTALRVAVWLDRGMLACELLNYHPLDNTQTTAIRSGDLLAFIAACGHAPHLIDLESAPSS